MWVGVTAIKKRDSFQCGVRGIGKMDRCDCHGKDEWVCGEM